MSSEIEKIPVFKPLLGDREHAAASRVLDVGWLGMGKDVAKFEEVVSDYLGLKNKHCVAMSTGHAVLHTAMMVAGVGEGDEVITPSFNNIADFQAILAVGAKPVFVDILDDTLCIDPSRIEPLITEKTKAIIAMDYGMNICEHAAVNEVAKRHNLRVIHDAAHSFGARTQDGMVGANSDLVMFSFDPVKTITCIDGGVLVTLDTENLERIHGIRLVGMGQPAKVMYQNQRAWTYDVKYHGYRYHMPNMHGAIGLAQMEQIETILSTRRDVARRYNAAFSGLDWLRVPPEIGPGGAAFLYYIRVKPELRDELRERIHAKNVDTGIHWQPGHRFELFQNCRRGPLDVTERIEREILTLPMHSCMPDQVVDRVVDAVLSAF